MDYKQVKEERKVYVALLEGAEVPPEIKAEAQARLDTCTPRYEALHPTHKALKTMPAEIVAAGLQHLVAPYHVLCGFSHNDIAIVAMRHQGEEGMVYMKPVTPEVIVAILSTALEIIVRAAEPLGRLAQFPEGLFEEKFQEMNAAWGRVLHEAGK